MQHAITPRIDKDQRPKSNELTDWGGGRSNELPPIVNKRQLEGKLALAAEMLHEANKE